MSENHRVPQRPLGSGRGPEGIQIFPIPRILPHLGEVGRIPARRLNARDFSEDDLGEKVGVIAAAQVDHVLDSSLGFER